MYNFTTNMYIFTIFMITMMFELLITKIIGISAAMPWGFTIALYLFFILYQVLAKANEDAEKNKIKKLLLDLMDSTDGIPIMNKNEKLIIKWDIMFKKLIENKEYGLYDNVIKTKTQHIDEYVNKYPSLLIDDSINLRERKYNVDFNSVVKGKAGKKNVSEEELIKDEESKRRIFIKELNADTASFCNYNSSIYIDVMLNYEYVPKIEDSNEHNEDYDGFSVWMVYKEKKYNVVPRIMVHMKRINKEKWFLDNINELLKCAEEIVNGKIDAGLYVDIFKLADYTEDILSILESPSYLRFKALENDLIVLNGVHENKNVTAYCELKTSYNSFEVVLKNCSIRDGETNSKLEIEKVIAIGNSYQPVVTMLEKMPILIKNAEIVLDNKDITTIVIS